MEYTTQYPMTGNAAADLPLANASFGAISFGAMSLDVVTPNVMSWNHVSTPEAGRRVRVIAGAYTAPNARSAAAAAKQGAPPRGEPR